MSDQGDLFEGRRLRDKGIERVGLNGPEFTGAVTRAIRDSYWQGQEVTAEDVRFRCRELGVIPHHSNAWGGATMKQVKDGLEVHHRQATIPPALGEPFTPLHRWIVLLGVGRRWIQHHKNDEATAFLPASPERVAVDAVIAEECIGLSSHAVLPGRV